MDQYIISDGMGEYVEYYNTNHIMDFTKDREKAMTTTDSYYAFEIAKIAQKLYNRKNMRMGLVM